MQHKQLIHSPYSNSGIGVFSISASTGQLFTHVLQLVQAFESIAGLDQKSFIKALAIDGGILSRDPEILGGHLKSLIIGASPNDFYLV